MKFNEWWETFTINGALYSNLKELAIAQAAWQAATQWRDPKTAPKDGTEFLAVMKSHERAIIVVWGGGRKLWAGANLYFNSQGNYAHETLFFYPQELKHWQPLPQPPRK